MKHIYGASLVFAQIVLAVALNLIFFSWAPWISCQPISDLPPSSEQVVQIPDGAKCFNYSHGDIVFSSRLPISDDPKGFYTLTAILFCCLFALFGTNYLHMKDYKEKKSAAGEK